MVLCYDSSNKRHVPEIPSFLWLKITPLYLDHILFIRLSVDGHWVISIYWLLWVTSLSLLVYEWVLESQLLILLGICPGGELLDCMIVLCLTFWGTAKLFSGGCAVLHSYQQNTRVPISPHPCQHMLFSFLFFICFFLSFFVLSEVLKSIRSCTYGMVD